MKIKDILKEKIPENKTEFIPSSYDIIGDIALIHIPEEALEWKKEIGEAICEMHPRIRAVFRKMPVEGEYRTRKLERIYGEGNPETEYKENGCKFVLDAEKVYFSPRLSSERRRISEAVQAGERVAVPFAGVGPFAIEIAKTKKPSKVVGIEINPKAIEYFKINARINKVDVEIIEGDAKKWMEKNSGYDRIVMPLPFGAERFLNSAFKCAGKNAIIHIYSFVERGRELEEAEEKIGENSGNGKWEIERVKAIRSYSSRIVQIVADVRVNL